ncbi:hypothetical protein AN448_01295 [Pseudomonas aeruginosa]|nr:hypothetical protein AN448_01295 [Pseudomonas aeruginosa]SUC58845.1 Eaa1 [Pseudomonas aeruginosa]
MTTNQNHPDDHLAIEALHSRYLDVLTGRTSDHLLMFQDEAYALGRARAVRQYECRETDLPWPVDYVRARAEYGVDHQDLDLSRTQALATAPSSAAPRANG